ncbi:hypothetical protein LTR08_005052 [Meristemomyces frigidus]|nr:hypothetical protein LTR08_005052 [Meristemomyces frigidus]
MALWILLAIMLVCGEQFAEAAKVVPVSMRRTKARSATHKRGGLSPRRLIPLTNAVSMTLYEIDITIGTPAQPITLDIDTGSSDIWMYSNPVYLDCKTCLGGSFDPDASSTSTMIKQDGFSIVYGDSTGASGDYFSDIFGLGGTAIENVTVAVATNLSFWPVIAPSIMGIGLDVNEAITDDGSTPYPGLLSHMVDQGLINTRTYSLWLDDLDAATGTILFGGYDTNRYIGNLTILEIQPDPLSGIYWAFLVPWTSLTLTTSSGPTLLTSDTFNAPALLDSGTSFTLLPSDVYNELAIYLGAYPNETVQQILVPCDIGEGSLDFGFGGSSAPIVSVPFAELAPLAFDLKTGDPVFLEDGTQACSFGIGEAEGVIALGDSFLRSAYVVYDLDSKLIGLAQSDFDCTSSNVVEIQTGLEPFGLTAG